VERRGGERVKRGQDREERREGTKGSKGGERRED
jgi:hypothetical protein